MIRSVMPLTACSRISSAFMNISISVAFLEASARSRSLGMVMAVSTTCLSSERPCSAISARLRPSNEKGRVTTATVSAPISRQMSAMTGVAPVPVPPPSPEVMNTMWLSESALRISSALSSAASRPIRGFAPAPSPSVMPSPSWMRVSARETSSAWASVFAAMKVTPCSPERIMLLMALPPAPPTPITLILADFSLSTYVNIVALLPVMKIVLCVEFRVLDARRPAHPPSLKPRLQRAQDRNDRVVRRRL